MVVVCEMNAVVAAHRREVGAGALAGAGVEAEGPAGEAEIDGDRGVEGTAPAEVVDLPAVAGPVEGRHPPRRGVRARGR